MTENPEFDHLSQRVPDVTASAEAYTAAGLPVDDTQVPLAGGAVWFEEGPADRLTALVLTGQPSTQEILGLELRGVS